MTKEELLAKQKEEENKKPAEPEVNEDGTLTVTVDSEEGEQKDAETPQEETPKGEEKPKEEDDVHKRNQEAARRRIDFEKANLRKENEELKRKLAEKDKSSKTPEEIDEGLAKAPQSTIQEMIDRKVDERVKNLQATMTFQNQFDRELESNKARVVRKYPNMTDPNSEESRLMSEVIENRPDLLNKAEGPVLAMVEMEELAEQRGVKLSKPSGTDTVVRKTNPMSLPQSRNFSSQKKTITLTRDQLDFCKENNIKPQDYAQNLVRFGDTSSSVEV